jgi:hypothetical protein
MKHLLSILFICVIGLSAVSQKQKQATPTLTKKEARQFINQALTNNHDTKINPFWALKGYIENDKVVLEVALTTAEFNTYYLDKSCFIFTMASLKKDKNSSFFLKALACSNYHLVFRYLENGSYTREIRFTPQEINNIYKKNINTLNIDKNVLKSLLIKTSEKSISSNIDNTNILNTHVSIDNGYMTTIVNTGYSYWNSIDVENVKALSIANIISFLKTTKTNKSLYLDIRKFCGVIGEKQIFISPFGERKIIDLKYSEITNFKPTNRQKQVIKESILKQENAYARSTIDLEGNSIAWVDIDSDYLCYHLGFYINNGELDPIILKDNLKKSLLESPLETSLLISYYKIIDIKGLKYIFINNNYDTISIISIPLNEIEQSINNLTPQ